MGRRKHTGMSMSKAGLRLAVVCVTACVALAGTAYGYTITINVQSDPPGLTVPAVVMDGDNWELDEGQANSFWVRSTNAHPGQAPYIAFESTSFLYNLDCRGEATDPNYADGGDPRCTPRVTVTGASLRKGNEIWPVEGAPAHCDWYQLHTPTADIVVNVTYKAIEIPVTLAGDAGVTGPAVVYHDETNHTAVFSEMPGYDVTNVAASNGTLTDNGDGTWSLTDVTEFAGVTLTVTATIIDPVSVPDAALQDEAAAQAALEALGLNVEIQYEYSDDVAAGQVISQSIAAGTTVPGSGVTTVTLVVSLGEAPPVPAAGVAALGGLMLALAAAGAGLVRRRVS